MNAQESSKTDFFSFLTQEELDAVITHLLFSILCVIILWIPIEISQGLRISFLVMTYIISIPLVGVYRNHPWTQMWLFSVILSVFQFFPDLFLVAQLNIIVFPEDGFIRVLDSVSIYMFGLWTIPFFLILFLGIRVQSRFSKNYAIISVGVFSLLVFGLSEQFLNFLWYAENVTKLGNIALYIIIPEIILGISAYWMYLRLRETNIFYKIFSIFQVMVLYLGNAAFFYYIFEKVIL